MAYSFFTMTSYWTNTKLKEFSIIGKYKTKGLPGSSVTNTGGFNIYLLILSNTSWHSSVHSTAKLFFNNLKMGSQVIVSWAINILMYFSLPSQTHYLCSILRWWKILNSLDLWMIEFNTLIFDYPKNFLDGTPNTHFVDWVWDYNCEAFQRT